MAFVDAETAGRERRRVAAGRVEQRQQRRRRARVADPLQRIGHRPPARHRLPLRVEHRRRQRVVGTQASSARRGPAARPRPAASSGYVRSSGSIFAMAPAATCVAPSRRWRPHRSDRRSSRAPRRHVPARSAPDRRAPSSSAGRAEASPISPSANAAICRTSNSSSSSRRVQRLDRLRQSDAPDGQRRAPPDARFGVARADE